MPQIKIDKDGNLVTKLKRVWISRDEDGWFDIWSFRPKWGHYRFYASDRHADAAGDIFQGYDDKATTPFVAWFNKHIEHSDGSTGGLPGPGKVWVVTLY